MHGSPWRFGRTYVLLVLRSNEEVPLAAFVRDIAVGICAMCYLALIQIDLDCFEQRDFWSPSAPLSIPITSITSTRLVLTLRPQVAKWGWMVCPDPLRGSKFWWKADFSVVSWCFMYHNQLLGCACQHPKVIQKNSCNFMCATIYTYMTNITLAAFIRPFASFLCNMHMDCG